MDIEQVLFSAGQKDALGAFERVLQLARWAAHTVFIGDHLSATVVTSDTPRRIAASHRLAIEGAVVLAGRSRYVDVLEPKYGGRMSPRVVGYFIDMAREASALPRASDYAPITAASLPPIFGRDGHRHA
jgi:hypothetical protein